MIKLSSLTFVLFFAFQTGFAQSPPKTVNQSIQWYAVNSTLKVHERINLYIEGQFRFAQEVEPMQHQIRTALEIKLSKSFSIVPLGYVYTWNYFYGKQPVSVINNEHRLYQQVVYKHALGRVELQHRIRMEERFLQHHRLNSEGEMTGDAYDDIRYRIRYRGLVNIPLNHATLEAKTWYVSIWDEVFVSWGKNVSYHKADQNRVFVGVGYHFTKSASIQAGGLYQMLKKSNGALQENNIGGMIQVTYNLDFIKKSK